jgi:cell division protein ZipA
MTGLRWILLAAGIALIFGLWWWETRKGRERPANGPRVSRPVDTGETAAAARDDAAGFDHEFQESEPEPAYAPTIERRRVERRPPLIEIPEDLEVDVSDFIGVERRRTPEPAFPPEAEPKPAAEFESAANEGGLDDDDQPDDYHRAPWVRTQPLERDEVAPQPEVWLPEPPSDAIERHTAEASQQRIVALRLVASGGNWSGAELREALEAEALEFGPYSVFHRPREDGKTLFYVASMMEPGSFDPAHMDEQEFPGISLFGVVPGPLDAPSTFDLVLATGRSLADRIKGQLQDEQGSTLTAQRILNLREELVQFEHRNRRLRRN